MKKIAYWNNYTNFANNQAFNPSAYGIGEDLSYPIILLREEFQKQGYLLETLDMDDVENYEAIIFSDVPNPSTCCKDITSIPKEKKFLVLEECEMIYHPNANPNLLKEYNKVFSYNDNLVKKCGYIKLNMPNKIKIPTNLKDFQTKKFATLISGNKIVYDKGELYSERLKTIQFMERYHPEEFDLYGIGWDKKIFKGPKVVRALNRFQFLQKLFGYHKCYKGKVEKKIQTLSDYKFCFCYENSSLIPGYISEKIMDCFFSGCVPVYYGAPNISDYIPKDCYIDFKSFKSYKELYLYLKNMSSEEYNRIIKNILNFLNSDGIYPFSAEFFANKVVSEVIS